MTEYSVEKFYGEYALKKEDSIIAVIDSGTNARKVCDLLNEQDKEIKNLKKALWEAETRYIEEKNEFSIDVEKDMEWLKKDFEREYWNE